ncbi:hypothetical protein [Paraburkholderia sp.]|uniref:hypothetical protein n=1 Tax=Paraburkholderia sp. TaxID=1926495 RepID=UPI0025D8D4F1|nr:hypothetical protein [Paraburkholderia sp.]
MFPFTLLGLAYTVAKDIKANFLDWTEEEKIVSRDWIERTDLQAELAAKGVALGQCRPDLLAIRQLDGWDVAYELDEAKRVARKLVFRDNTLLIVRHV